MQQAVQPVPSGQAHAPGELSMTERAVYVTVGLGLAAAAAKPRPNKLLSLLALLSGGFLAWRGAEGSCPVKAAVDQAGRA